MSELGLTEFALTSNAAPTTLRMDSKSAIDLAMNPVHHKRSKHIRIKYHWIREQVGANVVTLRHVGTKDMIADILTKALPEKDHSRHLKSVASRI